MNQLLKRIEEHAEWIWAAGLATTLIGELISAENRKQDQDGEEEEIVGDTISEVFKAAPLWVKLVIFLGIGFVLCHFSEWRIRDVTVQNAENVNIEVEEAQ